MDARCIRIKKFADTKISGYVWTGPESTLSKAEVARKRLLLEVPEDINRNFNTETHVITKIMKVQ